jgi:hypothetical protein
LVSAIAAPVRVYRRCPSDAQVSMVPVVALCAASKAMGAGIAAAKVQVAP